MLNVRDESLRFHVEIDVYIKEHVYLPSGICAKTFMCYIIICVLDLHAFSSLYIILGSFDRYTWQSYPF